ncbi:hypothetical protein C3747_143g81 [Trypanosoma cruzi]|nr:hypothetical protein TcYC6_0015670 [Trypanosoma cruzi]PWV04837.1 hypothetical protein C3747_143g81 [Trypanosoma cruzi]
MDAQSSDGSFVDHGQEVERGVGARPEWSVEKPGDVICDDDDDDSDAAVGDDGMRSADDVVTATSLSRDAFQLAAAMKKATLHTERLLQTNRQLLGENETLAKVNSTLVASNRSLSRQNEVLTNALTSISRRQEESQHAIVELTRHVREIKAALQSVVDSATKDCKATGPRG